MQSNSSFTLRQASICVLLALGSAQASIAMAEETLPEYTFMDAVKTGKNLTSFRLRYENVNQDGLGPAGTSAANNALKDGEGLTCLLYTSDAADE